MFFLFFHFSRCKCQETFSHKSRRWEGFCCTNSPQFFELLLSYSIKKLCINLLPKNTSNNLSVDKHLGLQSVLLMVKTGLEKCRREQGADVGWSTFKPDNDWYSIHCVVCLLQCCLTPQMQPRELGLVVVTVKNLLYVCQLKDIRNIK